jgi:hypothetical protein
LCPGAAVQPEQRFAYHRGGFEPQTDFGWRHRIRSFLWLLLSEAGRRTPRNRSGRGLFNPLKSTCSLLRVALGRDALVDKWSPVSHRERPVTEYIIFAIKTILVAVLPSSLADMPISFGQAIFKTRSPRIVKEIRRTAGASEPIVSPPYNHLPGH